MILRCCVANRATALTVAAIMASFLLPLPTLAHAEFATSGQFISNYSYDAMSRLTGFTLGTTNRGYNYYDSQGDLIAESSATGTQFTREYVYLGDIPVAVLQ